MQYLTTRNMSTLATPKIHKMGNSNDTPWMQPSATDPYYGHSLSSGTISDNSDMNSTYSMNIEQHNGKSPDGKPPYSYATLIKYAIERSADNKLTLSQIYQWVIDHYPYYGTAGSGWKNSIRHNLSLNKSFVRVPRPVNEPGKGSYWTVDQYASENEHAVRAPVRGRSGRSSSDSSLHRVNSTSWPYRSYRDGRSLSNDAETTSPAAARRTSQYGYNHHPYGYDRSFGNHTYGYPSYHYPQRMPSHETLLSARQHSSVTYSLPATASHPINNSMYLNGSPFYSHRQSCPDLSSVPSATYSETQMLPNFNQTAASSVTDGSPCDTSPSFSHYMADDAEPKPSASPIDGDLFYKKPSLPSPVLSSSTSPSSQHLSVADPLSMVTQHPLPLTARSNSEAPGDKSPCKSSTVNSHHSSPEFHMITSPHR